MARMFLTKTDIKLTFIVPNNMCTIYFSSMTVGQLLKELRY